jgi:hypothetical protein
MLGEVRSQGAQHIDQGFAGRGRVGIGDRTVELIDQLAMLSIDFEGRSGD